MAGFPFFYNLSSAANLTVKELLIGYHLSPHGYWKSGHVH
jgi:hypothetical protein